jgi:hypothetical protein
VPGKKPGMRKLTGSSHKSVQDFVFKVPQKIMHQLNLKAFNKIF